MTLRILPYGQPVNLGDIISCRPGQVSSMGLSEAGSTCDMTLLAFADGESVSEEVYLSDVMYVALEGQPAVVLPDMRVALAAGQVLAVPAGMLHAVEGDGPFKILQIAVC